MTTLLQNNGQIRGMMKAPSPHGLRAHALGRWLAGASTPRFGYDGINADAAIIHARRPNAAFVCGYDTGGWPWSQAEWNLFPKALKIHIATQAHWNTGDVLDVEAGDASPGQTESWIRMRKAAGYYRPTIYCSLSTVPAVRVGTGPYRLGVDYDIWVAHWTGVPHHIPGCAVTQYASANWADFDVIYDANWPHRKAPVPPKPIPVPPKPIPVPPKPVPVPPPPPPKPVPPPPPHVGRKRYESTGTVSLEMAAHAHGSTAFAIVTCSLNHETPHNIAALLKYLSTGCGVQDTMPRGLVYWVPAHG